MYFLTLQKGSHNAGASQPLAFPQHTVLKKYLVHYPKAKLVTAFDLFSGTFLSAKIGSYEYSEREGFCSLIDHFKQGDLNVIDRGFEGFAVMCEVLKRNQHFLMRVRATKNSAQYVRAFLASGLATQTIQILGKNYQGEMEEITIRLARDLDWKGDDLMVIVTDLTDEKKYKTAELLTGSQRYTSGDFF